ncbi:undecaprenyl-diphosphate phosphatase [Candidatus Pelagibacter sp.]|nr:undecaprenyl-diphosphate phosphatase [Candidatus Pelagibacter sp.]
MFQDFIEILILSAVQGISEFLPISSSAHLILISNFYNFSSSSLFIDIGLHLGSLFAIIYYFKKDLLDLRKNQKLLVLILVGSIPLIIIGFIIYSTGFVNLLRNIEIIAWTTLFFGLVLFLSDKRDSNQNISTDLNIKTILFIGVFQILALIPGVSRAGITLTAARFLRFNRVDSSKIAFLLSIPALAGASFLGLKDAAQQSIEFNYLLLISITLSFVFSFVTVKYFIKYVSNFSLTVFVIYRILVGLILLLVVYFPHQG